VFAVPERQDVLPAAPQSLRFLAGTMVGMTMANLTAASRLAEAQTAETGPVQLPQVSVEGNQSGQSGYQSLIPSYNKLTEPLVDTPQSITVVPQQLMQDQGVINMRDALRDVPGVSLAAGEAGQQGDNLTIRGFNAQNDFYLDGVRDFGSYYRDPFNLEAVEVLKGPASVLFGRGSSGGTVNQVSKQPRLKSITDATAVTATDGTFRFTSDVNRELPGIPNSAIRLNVMGNINGVAGRDYTKWRRFGFAPEVAFGLATDTRLTIQYLHQQSYDLPDYGIPWLNGTPAPVPHNNFYGYANSDYFRTDVNIGTVRLEHDINDHITLRDQLRYGSYNRALRVTEPQIIGFGPVNNFVTVGTPLSAIQATRHEIALTSEETILDNQTEGVIRFDTGPLSHTVITGVEAAHQTSDPTRYSYANTTTSLLAPNALVPSFSFGATPTTIQGTTVNNFGLYAIDTINIGEHWNLVGGWRWDRYNSSFHQIIPPTTFVSRNDDLPTYRAALVYKPTPDGSVYVAYGTSFDPSAESLSLSAATASVAPEKTTTYEIGTKWNLFNQRLTLNGAIYQIQKANAREVNPANPTTDILAGNYRVRGFEIGASGYITDAWEVFGGYSYNDGEVVSSPNPSEVGHSPPNAPRNTLSLWTSYTLPWHGIELGGGLNYVSSRTASTLPASGTNVILRAPGYVTMQIMAKYPINENLSAQVNVTNITNTYYYDLLHPAHVILGPSRAALFTISAKL
jgi:catecholate siderophore receptor